MHTTSSKLSWRALTSVLIATSFFALALSGAMLFVSPPGRVANWTHWTLWGLTKHQWTSLHLAFSTLFLVVAVAHAVFNLRPLLSYFKDRVTRHWGWRWEWLGAAALTALLAVATLAGWPPVAGFLAWNEDLKQAWDRPADRAPIPHAELLTVAELAEKAQVDMAVVESRWRAAGITNFAADTVLAKVAELHGRSGQQLYQILTATPETAHASPAGGSGRGSGGGPGRKTLAAYCAEQGWDVRAALERLRANGIQARESETLREIAQRHGFERPAALLDILQAP